MLTAVILSVIALVGVFLLGATVGYRFHRDLEEEPVDPSSDSQS